MLVYLAFRNDLSLNMFTNTIVKLLILLQTKGNPLVEI